MFDIKEILLFLGLASGPVTGTSDILMYKQKLQSEIKTDHNIQTEIKSLEYKKIWEEANDEDFASRWLKGEKASDKINKLKTQQAKTHKKIKALKQIIEKDSLERIKIEPIVL
jgi:hypothetical protein